MPSKCSCCPHRELTVHLPQNKIRRKWAKQQPGISIFPTHSTQQGSRPTRRNVDHTPSSRTVKETGTITAANHDDNTPPLPPVTHGRTAQLLLYLEPILYLSAWRHLWRNVRRHHAKTRLVMYTPSPRDIAYTYINPAIAAWVAAFYAQC